MSKIYNFKHFLWWKAVCLGKISFYISCERAPESFRETSCVRYVDILLIIRFSEKKGWCINTKYKGTFCTICLSSVWDIKCSCLISIELRTWRKLNCPYRIHHPLICVLLYWTFFYFTNIIYVSLPCIFSGLAKIHHNVSWL